MKKQTKPAKKGKGKATLVSKSNFGGLRDGEPIRVRRDLYEVRKRLEEEFKIAEPLALAENDSNPVGPANTRVAAIRFEIMGTGIRSARYPDFLDEKKRGELFVESRPVPVTCLYKSTFEDDERGTLTSAIVIEIGAEGSGKYKLHCLFSEAAFYSVLEDIDGQKKWSDWTPGPALLPDPVPGLDRSFRPPNGEEVRAKIFGVMVQGIYNAQDTYIAAEHGLIPFYYATSWQMLPNGSTWTGPFSHLEGPQTWQELPEGWLHDALENEANQREIEKAEKAIKQLEEKQALVLRAVEAAHSEEHAIQILTECRKEGEWTDPKTDKVRNFFAERFPMYSTYIAWIDAMIEQRKNAIALRYNLQLEFGASQKPSVDIPPDDNSSAKFGYNHTIKELASLAGMTSSGVRKALNEPNPKIKGVRVHFERNDDRKHARYMIEDASFEKVKRKVSLIK